MYTTEVFKSKREQLERYEALRGVPHLVKYTQVTSITGPRATEWCVAYPNDIKLPIELSLGHIAEQESEGGSENPTSDTTNT